MIEKIIAVDQKTHVDHSMSEDSTAKTAKNPSEKIFGDDPLGRHLNSTAWNHTITNVAKIDSAAFFRILTLLGRRFLGRLALLQPLSFFHGKETGPLDRLFPHFLLPAEK